jgi:hypothetical protein
VSSILVDHPDDWIGVPENWPNERWATPYEWASELVDALHEDWGSSPDSADVAFRDVLVSLANSLDQTVASRLYITSEGWSGPLYLAFMAVLPESQTIGMTAAQVAGSDDVDTIETPIVGEFTTRDGFVGASCTRYFNRDEPDRIVARADFVVQIGDAFVDFFAENSDLLDFERVRPRLRELAATVSSTN